MFGSYIRAFRKYEGMEKKKREQLEKSMDAFITEQIERFNIKYHEFLIELFAYLIQLIYLEGYADAEADQIVGG